MAFKWRSNGRLLTQVIDSVVLFQAANKGICVFTCLLEHSWSIFSRRGISMRLIILCEAYKFSQCPHKALRCLPLSSLHSTRHSFTLTLHLQHFNSARKHTHFLSLLPFSICTSLPQRQSTTTATIGLHADDGQHQAGSCPSFGCRHGSHFHSPAGICRKIRDPAKLNYHAQGRRPANEQRHTG